MEYLSRVQSDVLLACGFANPPAALACVRQWLVVMHCIKPALVLVDASPMALYAAHVAGLPAIALGHGFELPPPQPGLCFVPGVALADPVVVQRENRLQDAMAQLAIALTDTQRAMPGKFKTRPLPQSAIALQATARAALCTWPELDHFDRSKSLSLDQDDYIGPIWDQLPSALPLSDQSSVLKPWLDGLGAADSARPRVLCYLNLMDKSYDLLWQALRHAGARVLVMSPMGSPVANQSARGWGITVVDQAAPLDKLLNACDAYIGHGGMGLTSMALLAAKPVMLLPTQLEQWLLAARLGQQGLAICLQRLRHKPSVQLAVAQLLERKSTGQPGHSPSPAQVFAQRYAGYSPQQAVSRVTHLVEQMVG